MKDYQIFSDSSCDTPERILNQHHIKFIPFYVSFDQEQYYKEIVDMKILDFYDKLVEEKAFPKTSLPSVQDYINHFKEALDNGQDVLCICLSSQFSGSYQSAVTAKSILEEDYPDSDIVIINSILATACQGLLLLQAAYMKEADLSLSEVEEKLNELKTNARIMFTVGTLEYLQKGGRIGKVSSLAGTMLNLKPLIQLKEGELIPYGTIRGRNKSLDKILTMTKDYFTENNLNYEEYDFVVTTGTAMDEAEKVKTALEDFLGKTIDSPIFTIGVTIGTYTGPDAVGICFIKRFDA